MFSATGRDGAYFKWCLKVRGYPLTLCFSANNKDLLETNKQTKNQKSNNNNKTFSTQVSSQKVMGEMLVVAFLYNEAQLWASGFWIFPVCWSWPSVIISRSFMPPITLLWVLMITRPRQWERPSSVLGREKMPKAIGENSLSFVFYFRFPKTFSSNY